MRNIFDVVDISVFWDSLKTVMYFPMPIVLIVIAIILIEQVLDMLKNAFSQHSRKSEDYDDDDWDDDD